MSDDATILAVDDTPESLALQIDILTPAGYQVRPADSGELALAAVAANPPDLILLDVRTKGVNGLEVCRRLKAREETRHIPVILVSAFPDVKEWVEGLRLGAADYITKPFQAEELLTRVKAHLAVSRANVSLEQHAAALRQTNDNLQSEIVKRQRVEDELRQSFDRAERSRRAMLSTLEDQKRAEDALSVLASRQEAILAAVPEIVMEVDNHKVYLWANQVGLDFFGDDVIGREAACYFVGEQVTYQAVQSLFNGQQDLTYVESWQRRKDGEARLLAWRCRVLRDEHGNITGALSSARDITESRLAETRMAEQLDELRRWHSATLGREGRVLELKTEINDLLAQAGQAPRYPSVSRDGGR